MLSGPAGGVVALAETGREAGFDRVIGFDMGGTSTDVAHFDGEYERAFETEVAGVRMRAPMMSIHTVAAGGGSILHFDGARFRVGPDSAGANPGPKCYRRGGPLAVTDAGVPVRLGEVARIQTGPEMRRGIAELDGEGEVAVLVAQGEIVPGEQGPGMIGGDTYAGLLRDARFDDNVKAVVLRIDAESRTLMRGGRP